MSISIVIMISMTMIVIIGCYDARENDRVKRFTDGSRHLREAKEPRERRGYIEQCRASQFRRFFREERLSHVNVFAFLDPSWYYSYRQFIMLELLKKRLEKSGFSNVSFFVVTPPSYLMENGTEDSTETKAWKEVSKNIMESSYFLDAEEALFDDRSRKENGIVFLRDDEELGIWEDFRAAKDEVAVIDRCGKIAYQIVVPWSILYFPYVKAAILSTYREDPCGPCEVNLSSDSLDYEEYILKNIGRQVDNTQNMSTEETSTDLEAKISFDESKKMTHDKNTSTIIPLNASTYDSTIYNVTTETSIVEKGKSENLPNNDDVNEKSEQSPDHVLSTISNSETTEIYVENQDSTHRNNNNSFIENNDSDTNLTARNNGSESDTSLKEKKLGQKDESAEPTTLQGQNDEIIPLRIILYAPHLHEKNEEFEKYTHLVLKTGSPDYHDHFHSTTIDHKPVVVKKSDPATLGDKKLMEYVDTINESPGVYGEIADYWQTDESNNKNDDTEFTEYDYATVEDVDNTVDNSRILRPNNVDIVNSEDTKENDELNDFTSRRLIEHYNKLLPWIYYII